MTQPFDPKEFLASLPNKPGVYRMYNAEGKVLYVGKAKNLKKRVSSYFQRQATNTKTRALVSHIHDMQFAITQTEGEALILENNLIKEFKPRYNILLRDDKSYPYIYVSTEHDYPRIGFHRGAKRGTGRYFGPYPSAGAVRESLNFLQKIFSIRQCEDSFFKNRTRPCLQYQIKRCTAPCVDLISKEVYADDIRYAIMFLEGKSNRVIEELIKQMETASDALNFEKAAACRDKIATLRLIQSKQYVSSEGGDFDVVACVEKSGIGCVQVFFIRGGHNLGNKTFYPKHTSHSDDKEILSAFLTQYYVSKENSRIIPSNILVNLSFDGKSLLEEILNGQTGHKVKISDTVRGERAKWIQMALTNAENQLNSLISSRANVLERFEQLQDALKLDSLPQRLECFDISHSSGEATVASCVVMDQQGLVKSDYRKFNITGITPGDDYAAMEQALTRRYSKLKQQDGKFPDIIFIDGGQGQLTSAHKVMEELQINNILLVGVAKGIDRRPGLEKLVLLDSNQSKILPSNSHAQLLIQQIRDEAHRFAITAHRKKRDKARKTSVLEDIPGLGPKRRQRLLKQFGGLQEVEKAGIEDLASVPGISENLAQQVYDLLHLDA